MRSPAPYLNTPVSAVSTSPPRSTHPTIRHTHLPPNVTQRKPRQAASLIGELPHARCSILRLLDEVARIFQHSKRPEEEFSALSTIARYCVGLVCYVQSPLNEYAALGSDVAAISFDEDCQQPVGSHSPEMPVEIDSRGNSCLTTSCPSRWRGCWSI